MLYFFRVTFENETLLFSTQISPSIVNNITVFYMENFILAIKNRYISYRFVNVMGLFFLV